MKSALRISHVLKCAASVAVSATLVWSAFGGQIADLYLRAAIGNASRTAQAINVYASDWDQVLPRHDNNGSCIYGQSPCNTPDWGEMIFPNNNVAFMEAGKNVMFFGAIRVYMAGGPISYDPSMGHINWQRALQRANILGFTPPGNYNAAHVDYYNLVMSQAGVNILAVEFGPTSTNSLNNRPGAPKGRLTQFSHPESTIIAAMESAWDWNEGAGLDLGNPGIWPSYPTNGCWSWNSDGWTRYSIPKNYRQDPRDLQGGGMQWYGSPDRVKKNPNLQGRAVFVFADGHVDTMTYPESEQCATVPLGGTWRATNSATYTTFYPNWVPEIDPTP